MTWSEGLERLDNWPARLERAMLKLLGPAELRDLPAAIADVTALLNEQSQALELSSHARLLLTVMLTLSKREQAAQDRLDRAEKIGRASCRERVERRGGAGPGAEAEDHKAQGRVRSGDK